MSIKEICIELIKILEKNNEKQWALAFEEIVEDYELSDSKDISRRILKFYGGMGSFNDLVIYKDNKLIVNENNKLDELRSMLFSKITNM
ncbi:DUF6966 domain-containing protein [Labilibaculum euxinus]